MKLNYKVDGKSNSKLIDNKKLTVKTTVGAVLNHFDKEHYNNVCTDFDFYSLIMMLHQNKVLDIEQIKEVGTKLVSDSTYNINLELLLTRVMEKNKKFEKIRKLLFVSSDNIYTFENGNVITNFVIRSEF